MPELISDLKSHLTGAIDTHVHSGPDVRPRRTSSYELVRDARDAGMRAILLKNHHASTMTLAAALQEAFPGILVFGGLALNDASGGFNIEAVDAALRMGAAQIWMPTLCAAQERSYRGHAGTGLSVFDSQGALLDEVREILKLIAGRDAILGTGHLAPAEIAALVEEARRAGVHRILITHPEINFLRLSLEFQRSIAGPGVYFERCFVRDGFSLDWDGLAASIRAIGVDSTILATDLGQPENPHPVEGLAIMRREMAARGFTPPELQQMMCSTAAKLLKIAG
jgi:hypothetical protein